MSVFECHPEATSMYLMRYDSQVFVIPKSIFLFVVFVLNREHKTSKTFFCFVNVGQKKNKAKVDENSNIKVNHEYLTYTFTSVAIETLFTFTT